MKTGILGGTFNPIHLAHLRIAEEVRDRFALDRVIFIPAAAPPHKPMVGELPFETRCEMVRLAIADAPAFTVSTIEGEREGPSYSIDTLRALRAEATGDEFFFIVGSDSFLDIGAWHEYAAIFAAGNIVVVERPGAAITDFTAALPVAIATQFCYHAAEHRLAHRSGYSVYYLTGIPLDISSSSIRSLARLNRSIRYLVPEAVEHYIKEQGIYTDDR
ncbi:putative nicotinate-nucleotide adenylyltransferase [Geotalea uraniireducens]|uniref:Probable nicotinate-nucleotide adenylyltransferase n=1 Tax=Geotalea uraniireducens TaxID=351604 RepID=A0ABN6VT78_9BACT|nr:nicotinate-nucleotide adenylyltransferase [Geotalea uraniireducens]BDV41367.1 putative nicotinate-nucleotide adenylyltransferase [Geotalea uraniireducens]